MALVKYKMEFTKVILVLVTIILIAFSIVSITQQQEHSAQAVQNHTQTLNEIKALATEIKTSTATNHTVTIDYLNCVFTGLIALENQQSTQAQQSALAAQCKAAADGQ